MHDRVDGPVLVNPAGEHLDHLPVVGQIGQEELALHLTRVPSGDAVHRENVEPNPAKVCDDGPAELAAGAGDDDTSKILGGGHGPILPALSPPAGVHTAGDVNRPPLASAGGLRRRPRLAHLTHGQAKGPVTLRVSAGHGAF